MDGGRRAAMIDKDPKELFLSKILLEETVFSKREQKCFRGRKI